jgi:hypothetical protein
MTATLEISPNVLARLCNNYPMTHWQLSAKYDKALEGVIRAWIEEKTKEPLKGEFQAALKSGVALCQFAPSVRADS